MRSCFLPKNLLPPRRKVVFSPCCGAWQSFWEQFSRFTSLSHGVFWGQISEGAFHWVKQDSGWVAARRNSSSLLPGCSSWDPINSLISPFKYQLSYKSTLPLNYLTLSSPGTSSSLAPLTQIQIQGLVLLLEERVIFEDPVMILPAHTIQLKRSCKGKGSPEVQFPPGLACALSLLPLQSAQRRFLRYLNSCHDLHGRQGPWHVSSATWCLVCIETVPAGTASLGKYSLLSASYLIRLLPCGLLLVFFILLPCCWNSLATSSCLLLSFCPHMTACWPFCPCWYQQVPDFFIF